MQNDPNNLKDNVTNIMNTPDQTSQFDPADIAANKGMAILSYLGFLFLIPLLAAPNSRFARFHVNQGLVLFIAEAAYGIVYGVLTTIFYAISWVLGAIFSAVLGLVGIVFFVFLIIGILNAANGKAKTLPLIGNISIIK
ncbi:MAG: hypothetical protein ACK5JF_04945 [Oscillospiraceae bacterium]